MGHCETQEMYMWEHCYKTCSGCGQKCGDPGAVLNGYHSLNGTTHAFDTPVTYECKSGFKLVGEKTRWCGRDGIWTGNAPTCIKECDVQYCEKCASQTTCEVCAEGYGERDGKCLLCDGFDAADG